MRTALLALSCAAAMGCAQVDPPGPFAQVEEKVWRIVNRSATGRDGIFLQATLRSFAYEIVNFYANAEREGLDQEQLESRLSQFIYGLKAAKIEMDRKTLAFLAMEEPELFAQVAQTAKTQLVA